MLTILSLHAVLTVTMPCMIMKVAIITAVLMPRDRCARFAELVLVKHQSGPQVQLC